MASLIFFGGQGCIACIGTCCVSVGEWLSWRSQAQRHKGTNQNSLHCNLVAVLEHHQKTTPLMQNTIINIYTHIYTCLFISAWCMGYDMYLQTIFSGTSRGKNDTKTIPERYPKTPFESLGQEVTHPPTHLNIDTLSSLVQRIPIPYFMSGSNSLKRGKEEPNKATSFQHHHGNVHLKMQIQWIDQIQYPISLVASLDTVPVICWNSTSFTSIGKVHAHTHTNKHRVSFLQCSPEKRPFLPLDARISNVENALYIAGRKKNLKNDRGRDCNLLPCRNASES